MLTASTIVKYDRMPQVVWEMSNVKTCSDMFKNQSHQPIPKDQSHE